MILQHLSILNYKNISSADLHLSAKLNCFFGMNGMGKTNLLDAVYYLSFCKSSTAPSDSQNILHGEDMLMIQGEYVNEQGDPEEIYCGFKRGKKKIFKHNKKVNAVCKAGCGARDRGRQRIRKIHGHGDIAI